MTSPEATAHHWLYVDPDPEHRARTKLLLTQGGPELEERFGDHLRFGTAGIRGPLGAGPMRINQVLIRATTVAIGQCLLNEHQEPTVVIGFDARQQSDILANDVARTLAGLGIAVTLLPEAIPTPVLAYTLLHTGVEAGIMITASHNPRHDNGMKVYWSDAAQIISPIDEKISALLQKQISDGELPRESELADHHHPLITRDGTTEIDSYISAAVRIFGPAKDATLNLAYTPLHGVGYQVLAKTFAKSGLPPPYVVTAQVEPDGEFPTIDFPNPEEPGSLDLLLNLARNIKADVALANDPDADRLAVIIPTPDGWRHLSGDETGGLLAEYVLDNSSGRDRLVVTTIVSSRLLAAQATHHGVQYKETLTGFKWIIRPALEDPKLRLVFGYEEALGYLIGDIVRDKDGITAAVALAQLAMSAKAEGRTILDLLHDLWHQYGVHRTTRRTQRFENPEDKKHAMSRLDSLRRNPPTEIAGYPILATTDYREDNTDLPSANLLEFNFDGGRLLVRPSGTEPLLKIYAEVVMPTGTDVTKTEIIADNTVAALANAALDLLL